MAHKPRQPLTALSVWKKTRECKKEIEAPVKTFPPEERYNLCSQTIRPVRSVNANIAEGEERFGYPGQINYCVNARGSLHEPLHQLIDAYGWHCIHKKQLGIYKAKHDEVGALQNGRINHLRKLIKIRSSHLGIRSSPGACHHLLTW